MESFIWRLVERRLRRVLPPERMDSTVGDLLEDFERRVGRDGRLRAAWWVVRETRSIVAAYNDSTTCADARSAHFDRLSNVASEVAMTIRVLGRQPLLIAGTVLPVALALAASTALFSIADGVLYRELRLVSDATSTVAVDFDASASSFINRRQTELAEEAFARAPGLSERIYVRTRGVLDPEVAVDGIAIVERNVSANFFTALGIPVAMGRGLVPSDARADGPPAVVVGHALWQRAFDGAPGIVGRVVDLAGVPVHVVGVAPRTFDFPEQANVWSLWNTTWEAADGPVPQYARVTEDFGLDATQTLVPAPYRVQWLTDAVRLDGATALAFLFGATALLLLVSWLQVGALLFSRAAGRTSEIGIRLALGAGRARLMRAFIAEGATIAVLALALGWLAAPAFVAGVTGLLPAELTAGQQIEPDLRALAFAGSMAGFGVVLLAVLPADLLRRARPFALLSGTIDYGVQHWSTRRIRSALLLGQVSVTVLLLYLAGLVAHSFLRVSQTDRGFDPDRLLIWNIPQTVGAARPMPAGDVEAQARRLALQERQHAQVMSALAELSASTDVAMATAARYHPIAQNQVSIPVTVPSAPSGLPVQARLNRVTPGYFRTLGIDVIEGTPFEAEVQGGDFDVAVVNETMAARLRPLGSVIGLRIDAGSTEPRIVGIVADHVDSSPDRPPDPQVFQLTPPNRAESLSIGLARIATSQAAVESVVRNVVRQTWGTEWETTFTTMDEELARATVSWRGRALFLLVLAGLCLPLAMAGIFGALSYDLRSRTRELAVRLALGADPAGVRRHVVGRALVVVLGGLAAGSVAGALVGRLMQAYLFGIGPADPATVAGVGIVLLVTALLAAFVPAWRASRTDPAAVLREG